jgi:hypothetical protein
MPPDIATSLTNALRPWIRNSLADGLYTVSMDHSPSEQLTDLNWHTTVLVISAALEHRELANRIALQLRPQTRHLCKWSKTSNQQRKDFLPTLMSELKHSPRVAIFALSAKETTVRASLPQLVSQLQLQREYSRPGDGSVLFGPFLRGPSKESITVRLSEKRAAMAMFIAHFVKRMHQHMHEAANIDRAMDPCLINWNFYSDKFPGIAGSDMDLMFQILLGLDHTRGRIQWGYFKDGGQVEIDLLADNLAGSLNNSVEKPLTFSGDGGLFYWEKWG